MKKKFLPFLVTVLWFAIAFSGFFTATSCQDKHMTDQFVQMDTLEKIMQDVDGALLIDEDAVGARYDTMDVKLKTILAAMPDSGKGEVRSALVKYSAIRSNYGQVLKDYPVVSFDVDKEKEEIKVLRQALENGDLKPDVFETKFRQEKMTLAALKERIKTLNYSVFAVEQDYRRASDVLNPVYERLK